MQRLAIAAYVIIVLTMPAEALIGHTGSLAVPGNASPATTIATTPAPEAPAQRD